MRQSSFLFTSESVTEGHQDKIADQISDGILDAIMAKDKNCRVACETLITTGLAFVAGEISPKPMSKYLILFERPLKALGIQMQHGDLIIVPARS